MRMTQHLHCQAAETAKLCNKKHPRFFRIFNEAYLTWFWKLSITAVVVCLFGSCESEWVWTSVDDLHQLMRTMDHSKKWNKFAQHEPYISSGEVSAHDYPKPAGTVV